MHPPRSPKEAAINYWKSVLARLLATVAGTVSLLLLVVGGIIIYNVIDPPIEGSIGWDPISLWKQSPLLPAVFAIICFLIGFLWEYRRLARRSAEQMR